MGRVGFAAGVTAAAVTGLCVFFPNAPWAGLLAVVLLPAAVFACLRERTAIRPCLLIFAVGLVFFARCRFFFSGTVEPVSALAGKTVKAAFTVTDVRRSDGGALVTARVDETENGLPSGFRTQFYTAEDAAPAALPEPGDTVRGTLRFSAPDGEWRQSSYAAGVYIRCSAADLAVTGHKRTLSALLWRFRRRVKNRVFSRLPYDSASLMCGLLLGDTAAMRPAVSDALRRCGLSHLTAVSGVHLSVFCYSIFGMLQKRFSRRRSAWLSVPFVWAVMAAAGFRASVVRAGVMALILLVGYGLFLRADAANSLGLAAVGMLFFRPFYLFDRGFALSFSAMLGMVLLVPALSRRFPAPKCRFRPVNAVSDFLTSSLICTVSASLCTLPASALFFGEVSLIAPLTNIFCTVPAMLSMLIGAAAAVFPVLFRLARPLLAFVLWVCTHIAKFPWAAVYAGGRHMRFFFGVALALAGVCLFFRRARGMTCLLLSLNLLLGVSLAAFAADAGAVYIGVANTGDGMAVTVTRNRDCVALAFGGDGATRMFTEYAGIRSVARLSLAFLPAGGGAYGNPNALAAAGFDTVAVPESDRVFSRTLRDAGQTVCSADGAEFLLFGDTRARTVGCGGVLSPVFETDGLRLLVLCGVPDTPQRADVLVTRDTVPADVFASVVLFCGDGESAARCAADVSARGMTVYAVDEGELAELRVKGGRARDPVRLL